MIQVAAVRSCQAAARKRRREAGLLWFGRLFAAFFAGFVHDNFVKRIGYIMPSITEHRRVVIYIQYFTSSTCMDLTKMSPKPQTSLHVPQSRSIPSNTKRFATHWKI